jgi:hypothetical protein
MCSDSSGCGIDVRLYPVTPGQYFGLTIYVTHSTSEVAVMVTLCHCNTVRSGKATAQSVRQTVFAGFTLVAKNAATDVGDGAVPSVNERQPIESQKILPLVTRLFTFGTLDFVAAVVDETTVGDGVAIADTSTIRGQYLLCYLPQLFPTVTYLCLSD